MIYRIATRLFGRNESAARDFFPRGLEVEIALCQRPIAGRWVVLLVLAGIIRLPLEQLAQT